MNCTPERQTSGQAIPVRWVAPHNFTQHVPQGVDFRVMLTFFEFYETLLGFVLYKLYGDLGVRYPLPTVAAAAGNGGDGGGVVDSVATLHPTLGGRATTVLAANLSALQRALDQASRGNSAAEAVKDALQSEDAAAAVEVEVSKEDKKAAKASKKKQKQLMKSIDEALKGVEQDGDASDEGSDGDEDNDNENDEGDEAPIAAPLREALDAIDDSEVRSEENAHGIITDPDAQKRHALFRGLTFFLSREVPRGYLELIVLSYGGKVGWEGKDSPVAAEDGSVTHHVVDRPQLLASYAKLPKSREYIQPQWILDCANFNFILPIQRYGVGAALPPHLSPWVDDGEEGYVPKYKEEVERMKNGEVLEAGNDAGEDASEGDGSTSEDEGLPSSKSHVLRKDDEAEGGGDEDDSDVDNSEEEEEDHDDEEAGRKALKKKETEVRKIRMRNSALHNFIALRTTTNQNLQRTIPTNRTRRPPASLRPSCLRRPPASTAECSTASPRNRREWTTCTRSDGRSSLRGRSRRRGRRCRSSRWSV